MARRVLVDVVCDLCGGDANAAPDMQFHFDGTSYAIDLCPSHAEQFREAIRPFLAAGQGTGPGTRRTRVHGRQATRREDPVRRTAKGPARRDPRHTAAIRQWARENGFPISERGRIPVVVETAFNARGTG
jgi:hypothetical protein